MIVNTAMATAISHGKTIVYRFPSLHPYGPSWEGRDNPIHTTTLGEPITDIDYWQGRYVWCPLTLRTEDGRELVLPDAVVALTRAKQIITTQVVGMTGTIKEYISAGDYDLNISVGIVAKEGSYITDLCKITLPRRMLWDGMAESPVRRGDRVRVWLGYDDDLKLLFVGYIREVGVKTPIVLSCEDEMYRLKSMLAKPKAYRSVSVTTLIREQGYTGELRVLGEQSLGQYRVTVDTLASLLGRLKDQGVRVFFRLEGELPVLYAGVLLEHSTDRAVQVISSGGNLISDSQLEQQQHADTMRLKIKVVSHQRDNKRIKVEVGDQDGELRTLHTYGRTKSEAEAWGKEEYKRLKSDGLKGTLTTFCAQPLDKLDHVAIKLEGKRMGVYQVDKVVIKYGAQGYHQEVTLGQRVRE